MNRGFKQNGQTNLVQPIWSDQLEGDCSHRAGNIKRNTGHEHCLMALADHIDSWLAKVLVYQSVLRKT